MLWDKKVCIRAAFVTILLFSLMDVATFAMMPAEAPFLTITNSSGGPSLAVLEPDNSLADGNWIILGGGNTIRVPDMSFDYSGSGITNGSTINKILSDIPFLSYLGFGTTYEIANSSPHSLTIPYNTTHVYSETSGKNIVTATFYGNPADYATGSTLTVELLNLTKVTGKIDFTNSKTIQDSAKLLTLADIKNSSVKSVDMTVNNTGDIPSIESGFSLLSDGSLSQGYYLLMVIDNNHPDITYIVAETPIIVAKSDMTVDQIKPSIKPGDSLTFNENMPVTESTDTYTYVTAMIPEANYSADIANVPGSSEVDLKIFGLTEKATVKDDSSIHLQGLATDMILNKDDFTNMSKMKDIMMNELNGSSVSLGITTTTLTADVPVVVNTKSTMPQGKYIVLTAVIDRNTGLIAAINQTTFNMGGMWTYKLTKGWNLISIPIVPQDNNLTAFFGPTVMSDIMIVWEYNSSNKSSPWAYYTTQTSKYKQGKLTAVNERQGYWVECYNPITFTVTGNMPASSGVTLNSGWNLVGNPTMDARQPWNVYSSARITWGYNSTNVASPWAYYTTEITKYKQGKLTELDPGFGYWVEI